MTPAAVPSGARRDHRAAVAHLQTVDPVLAHLIDRHPDFDPRAWRSELPRDAFGGLAFQVIGQQLSVAATRRILGRLQAHFGGRMPSPAALLATNPDEIRATGLSGRKVATLQTLAARFVDGSLSDQLLDSLDDDEIESRLTAIPGIGPWTVHGFLIIVLDRPDVVLPGDLALRRAIERVYGLDHLPTQAEVLAIAEPWRPYRSLASAYLFQSGSDAPTPGRARPDGDVRPYPQAGMGVDSNEER